MIKIRKNWFKKEGAEENWVPAYRFKVPCFSSFKEKSNIHMQMIAYQKLALVHWISMQCHSQYSIYQYAAINIINVNIVNFI